LRARELIDDHGPVAQFFELVGKGVGGDAIGGRVRLVVGEAKVARFDCSRRRASRDEAIEPNC
jgi:hypothetical protein